MKLVLGSIPWVQYSVVFLTVVAFGSFAMKVGGQFSGLLHRNLEAAFGIKLDPVRFKALGSLACLTICVGLTIGSLI